MSASILFFEPDSVLMANIDDNDHLVEPEVYILFFIEGDVPIDDGEVDSIVRQEIEFGIQEIDTDELSLERLRLFAGFFRQFPDLFPPLDRRPPVERPEGLVLTSWSDSLSLLSCPMDLVEELVPFGIGLAKELGVTVFDSVTGNVNRPHGYEGLEMTREGEPIFIAPTLKQIHEAVMFMTPEGGPSFLILEGQPGRYAQIAGGNDQFTCEWRDFRTDSFRHWVAGRKSPPGDMVSIPTNGYSVEVYENERLSSHEVTLILQDYAEGKKRSDQWEWRDKTDEFSTE